MRLITAAGLLAAAVTVSACSGGGQPGVDRPPTSEADIAGPSASPSAPPKPAMHRLGEAVEVTGGKGNPIKFTPTGVYYHQGDKRYGEAENGTYAAVAYTVEAEQFPDGMPFDNGGLTWRADSANFDSAASPPWAGRVNEPSSTLDVQPGEQNLYVTTFDVPQPGGVLVYVNPGTHTQVRWQIPATASGKGYKQVLTAIRVLGMKP